MRKVVSGAALMLIIVFCYQYCEFRKEETETINQQSQLIREALKNVGKLIVTEGEYAQVFTYEDSKQFYFDILSASKKALVMVNAKATIAYDLNKVTTQIDDATKTIHITQIPDPELSVYPDIEYYDIQQDLFNPFEAGDHQLIKERVTEELQKKIKTSVLYTNAQNRLISELQKIYILTSAMGWTLTYNENPIENVEMVDGLINEPFKD